MIRCTLNLWITGAVYKVVYENIFESKMRRGTKATKVQEGDSKSNAENIKLGKTKST